MFDCVEPGHQLAVRAASGVEFILPLDEFIAQIDADLLDFCDSAPEVSEVHPLHGH